MSFMRFSAVPTGCLGDRKAPWAIYGDRLGHPDGLEASAFVGINLAQIAPVPSAPMFDQESLFGMHLAGLEIDLEPGAPVVVFVHGFCYEPRRPVAPRCQSDNAHRCLYHFSETPGGPGSAEEHERHTTPWFARAMLEDGLGPAEYCGGLAVGYSFASYGGAADTFLPGLATRLRDRAGLVLPIETPGKQFEDAYTDAGVAGCGLAALLVQLRARLDNAGYEGQMIDIVCHSLGARTVLTALSMLAQRSHLDETITRIDRVLMLSGACYWGQAADSLANIRFAAPAHQPRFHNFTTNSDDVLRHFRKRRTMNGPFRASVEMLGLDRDERLLISRGKTTGWDGIPDYQLYAAFGDIYDRWVDIPIDTAATRRWGKDYGLDLGGGPSLIGNHWISFTHPGNWALYRNILHDRQRWTIEWLKENAPPRQ
ncbi:alpha/beta hydrolase [Rhodobacteraceae bacterium NNCM2]|nr:alpha/beta hydrolase [Coraliihabitans acroporae]